jgi:hypothetical protein
LVQAAPVTINSCKVHDVCCVEVQAWHVRELELAD